MGTKIDRDTVLNMAIAGIIAGVSPVFHDPDAYEPRVTAWTMADLSALREAENLISCLYKAAVSQPEQSLPLHAPLAEQNAQAVRMAAFGSNALAAIGTILLNDDAFLFFGLPLHAELHRIRKLLELFPNQSGAA